MLNIRQRNPRLYSVGRGKPVKILIAELKGLELCFRKKNFGDALEHIRSGTLGNRNGIKVEANEIEQKEV